MKKVIFFGVCLLISFSYAHSQESEKTRIYEVRSNIAVVPCDVKGRKLYNDDRYSIPPYQSQFALIGPLDSRNDTVVIRFLTWANRQDSLLQQNFNKAVSLAEVSSEEIKGAKPPGVSIEKYFLLRRYDLDSNCVKVYAKGRKSAVFTLGLITMPLKLRLGKNFDFQGNLSLGTTAGAKFRMSKYNPNYLNILFGASISTISLDSFSTQGKIVGQPLTNIAVFSPSFGLVFEFGKAQAGLFYGWDFLNKSTQSKYTWIHDRKPWLTIGFGFTIFTIDSKSNNTQSQTQPGSSP